MNDSKSIRHFAYTFLREHYHGALATSDSSGLIHVTPVYCVADEDLRIYFMTIASGTKYSNILSRPAVAMTFVDDTNLCSIQLRGTASCVEDSMVEDRIFSALWRLRIKDRTWPIPPIMLYEQNLADELRIIRVDPGQMTYASFTPAYAGNFDKLYQKIL